MKRDLKYILKRILIGAGIALLLGFIRQNVYASEVNDLLAGNNTTFLDSETLGDIYLSDIYVNYYQNQYVVPIYNISTHKPTTPGTSSSNGCNGLSFRHIYYANVGANDPYVMPSTPSTSVLGSNWGGCSLTNTRYMTLGGVVLDLPSYTFEKDKYYKINIYYLNEYSNPSRDLTINHAINDPEDLKVQVNNTLEVYSMGYTLLEYNEGPFVEVQNTTSSNYNWLLISIIIKANEDTSNPIIFFGYTPGNTLISGDSTYPSTFTSNDHLPLLMFNYNVGTSSWANAMNLTSTRPFIYEYAVNDPSIQIPDFSTAVEDTLQDINDDISSDIDENGNYTGEDDSILDSFGGGGGAGIAFGSNNISDLLVIPLRFLQKFNSDTTCEPIEIPFPQLNNNFTLPCPSVFIQNVVGAEIFQILQIILGVGLGFKFAMALYHTTLEILDPSKIITN